MFPSRTGSVLGAGQVGMHVAWSAILFLLLVQIEASETTPRTCAYSVITPGVTVPQGDIVVEEGDPLKILCMLDLSHPQSKNHSAADLRFYRNDSLVSSRYLQVVNETTLRFYDERPSPSKTMYYCKLKPKVGTKEIGVCLNTVMVGWKPQPVDNFNCTSYNWMNLKCTWVPKYNPIPTSYKLTFRLSGSPRHEFGCPNNTERQNMCFWDDSTTTPYRQVYAHYYFTITGENDLGSVKFPVIPFDHYKNIIAGKPNDFKVLNKTSSSFYLEWKIPYPLDSWANSNVLEQKIAYAYGAKDDNDGEDPWHIAFRGQLNCSNWCTYNLTGLRYAHVLYDVRVYLKTHEAPEEYWSDPASVVQRTAPAIPPEPPRTDIGSFEVSGRLPNRDVTVYWQSVPEKLQGGNNFSYKIVDVLQNGISVPISVNYTGKKSAILRDISLEDNFTVRIASANELGLSSYYSQVFIPSSSETLPEPRSFTKTYLNNGVFRLTWSKPERHEHKIKSYTIFWCDSQNDRPETCTGFLNWTHVDSSTRNVSLTLKPIMYHFAISANSETASSGMVWASCSMLSDRVDKLKTVLVKPHNATSMSVEWKLDCTDANNVVRGFQIFYCMVKDKVGHECKDAEKNVTIYGDHTTASGMVTGLQPYTTYKASVAIVTKIGAGLKSDPELCTLSEAAPSTPPLNIQISNVTNSSILVSWSPPRILNGVLRHYEVHCNGNVTKVLVDNPIDDSHRSQVLLSNLIGYSNNTIQLKACTTACSELSEPIVVRTLIGTPGAIGRLRVVDYGNETEATVSWLPPSPPGGRVDYYIMSVELTSSSSSDESVSHEYNVTGTEYRVPIPGCSHNSGLRFKFSVRAVNVDGDDKYMGPWSEPEEIPCLKGISILYILLIIFGAVILLLSLVGTAVCAKRMYYNCREMSDVEIKVPTGILPPNTKDPDINMTWANHARDNDDPSGKARPAADKERLLQRKEDRHGESSSSGHETASSSTTSGTHISTDSGTEVDQHDQSYGDSAKWPANIDASAQKRDKVVQPWDPYIIASNAEGEEAPKAPVPTYPNLGMANWSQSPSGYVIMNGAEIIPNGKMIEPPAPSVIPVAPPQVMPPPASRGYVARDALPSQPTWAIPQFVDGYVQMGDKPVLPPPDSDEGVMEDDKDIEMEEDVEIGIERVIVEEEVDPMVIRSLTTKLSNGIADECERTSVEAPLVPSRNSNGYVSHFQPKASPTRHELLRTPEKNISLSKSDCAKSYTRLGEKEPAIFGARPDVIATSVVNPYVPHSHFEPRVAPGVVRD